MKLTLPLLAIVSALSVTTSVILLSYLGASFQADHPIDPTDWKRKWLIFFAYFNLVLLGIFSLMSGGLFLLPMALPIMTNIVLLTYLGTSFSVPDQKIDAHDWRRKWLIFFAWFGIAVVAFQWTRRGRSEYLKKK